MELADKSRPDGDTILASISFFLMRSSCIPFPDVPAKIIGGTNILGIVTPCVAAFCAPEELRGGFVCGPCLQHPPKRCAVLAMGALHASRRKRVNDIAFHDFERSVRTCPLALLLCCALFLLVLFGLKAALGAFYYLFVRRGPQTCFALWTETQGGKTPLLSDCRLDHAD